MKKGDFVRINFIGRIKDTGEIFDITYEDVAKKEGVYSENLNYKPIPVIVGEGFVIKGVDNALLDMDVGERKKIEIKPEDGFGKRDPNLVKVFPLSFFKERNITPKAGMIVDFSGRKGRIQSINSGRVMVDFNNPLAGRVLEYEVEIVEKIDDNESKIKAIFEYFGIAARVKMKDKEVEIETYLPLHLKARIISLIFKYCGVEKLKIIEIYEKKKLSRPQ